MLNEFHENAYSPTLEMNIHPDVNRLTCKIDSVSLGHGKPPSLGSVFAAQKLYRRKGRLAFFFSIIGPAKAGTQLSALLELQIGARTRIQSVPVFPEDLARTRL